MSFNSKGLAANLTWHPFLRFLYLPTGACCGTRDHVMHVESPAIDVGGVVQRLQSVLAVGAGEYINQVRRPIICPGFLDDSAYDPRVDSTLLLLKIDRLLREDACSPGLDSILSTQKVLTLPQASLHQIAHDHGAHRECTVISRGASCPE